MGAFEVNTVLMIERGSMLCPKTWNTGAETEKKLLMRKSKNNERTNWSGNQLDIFPSVTFSLIITELQLNIWDWIHACSLFGMSINKGNIITSLCDITEDAD